MMNKSLQRLALLCVLASGSAIATEMRTPWISQNGPLRYLEFEKLHKDKSNLNWWSTVYSKDANKAYLKHGVKSQPLSALIFNQADFTFNQFFPNSQVPFGFEEYSPFLRLYKMSPRVSYSETGMTFGGCWDCPVWKNKGRLGVRASVPFRQIEMERDDSTDKNEDPTTQFIATQIIRVDRNSPNNDVNANLDAFQTFAPAADLAASIAKVASLVNVNATNVPSTAATPVGMALNVVAAASTPATIAQAIGSAALVSAGNSKGDENVNEIGFVITGMTSNSNNASPNAVTLVDKYDVTLEQTLGAMLAGPLVGGRTDTMTNDDTPNRGIVLAATAPPAIAAVQEAAARGNRAADNNQPDIVCNAYRLDFVQALQNSQHQSALQIPDQNVVNLFGNDIAVTIGTTGFQKNRAAVGIARAADRATLEADGFVAWMPAPDNTPANAHVTIPNIIAMDAALMSPVDGQIGVFDSRSTTDYTTIYQPNTTTFTPAAAAQAQTLWLTFRRAADSNDPERFSRDPNGNVGQGGTIARTIEDLRRQYSEHPLAFLERNGFDFDTKLRSGIGDIDVDLFYEHTFSEKMMGELCLGVRFPTAGNKDEYGSPYQPIKGNGDHFEIKLAALLAYQLCRCMNIKVDASYSFVLESTEERMAAFKGATIKNIGPRADAKVDWGYFVGHFDMTFFHPKTSAVRSMVGYEFYYKTQDRVSFKQSQLASWLGGQYVNGVLQPALFPLDNNLARQNTESIAHKLRTETSVQINTYFELFAGGTFTFAGQNVMRDSDFHGGFNVRF